MAYLFDQQVSDHLSLHRALQKIYGCGFFRAHQLCAFFGLHPQLSVKKVPPSLLQRLTRVLKRDLVLGSQLKRDILEHKKRRIRIGSYRGFRYMSKLPVHGQRTHTNARTVRKSTTVE